VQLLRRFVIALITIVLLGIGVTDQGLASSLQAESATPTADQPSLPQFSMVPVGNHPDGFFRDIEIKPGASVELAVVIVNTGSAAVDLRAFKVNALSGVNGRYVSGKEADVPVGSAAWIDFPATTLALEPQQQREITFTVSVPAGTNPGQYISGLVVETSDALPIPGTESLKQKLGHAISVGILVPGESTYGFELGDAQFSDDTGLRVVQVPITNTGNYLVRPVGEATLTNSAGEVALASPIEMGSVYAGWTTAIEMVLPDQMPPGDYTVALSLIDDTSGATDEITSASITIPEPKDPSGLNVDAVTIEPNADPIVFANVAVTIANGGQQIPAADVTLHVLHDGKEVERFPLASNQVLPNGPTELTARYLPAEMWTPGSYNFTITVTAVDPDGGQETILATYDVAEPIEVP
jgi:hypothetical protein